MHPEPVVVDAVEVLAHRVPLAEIARRVRVERAADRRPVAVGRDHERRVEHGSVGERELRPCRRPGFTVFDRASLRGRRRRAGARRRRARRRASAASRPRRARRRSAAGGARGGRSARPAPSRARTRAAVAPRSAAETPSCLEQPQRVGGEPVAARLVARERAPCRRRRRVRPRARGRDRGRGSGGPGAHHDDVDVLGHRRPTVPGSRDRPSGSAGRRSAATFRRRGRGDWQNRGSPNRRRAPVRAQDSDEEESYERRRLRQADPRPGRAGLARRPTTRSIAAASSSSTSPTATASRWRCSSSTRPAAARSRSISMAPNDEVSGLRTALAMGAAKAILVSDPALAGSDALVDREGARQEHRARRRHRPRARRDRVVRRLHRHGARAGRGAARLARADVLEARRDRRRQGQGAAPDRSRLRRGRGFAARDRRA